MRKLTKYVNIRPPFSPFDGPKQNMCVIASEFYGQIHEFTANGKGRALMLKHSARKLMPLLLWQLLLCLLLLSVCIVALTCVLMKLLLSEPSDWV